jgi:type I restriction enzyme S subunit
MKDSGIDWLGEIPEHWEVKKLKYVVDINKETLSDKTDGDYQIEYIDIGNVEYGKLKERPKKLLFEKAPSRARRVVNSGDTLISTVRTYLKAILFIENANDNLIASTGFAVIAPSDDFLPDYLFYILSSEIVLQNITASSVGVSYPAINASEIGGFYSWFPEKQEQKTIIDFIVKEINKINTKVEKTKKLIDLLSEYKQSLISEVVTGKIKVI